ncbi:MAG: segregation and condensation protein A [Actinomycetota bacterium]
MSFPVRLEVFEGPLDLLLQLVSKERVNVAEVSISTITRDYLQAVHDLEIVDVDVASSFLILAATLLELKSIKLLARRPADPQLAALLEERDLLLHRLVAYATFKQAAAVIADRMGRNAGYHPRTAGLPESLRDSLPDPLQDVSLERFQKVAIRALAPKPQMPVDTSFIRPARISVGEMAGRLARVLASRGSVSFRDLCGGGRARIEVVLAFLALLELFKDQRVELEQSGAFEEITVRWREPQIGPGV